MQNFKLAEIVINWYKKNFRNLPWRPYDFKQKVNPYFVFLSEFMLQQTMVKTVIPYFLKFIDKYPKINILANAKLDEILTMWSGLGYYRRATNLYLSSNIIHNELSNVIPNDYASLIKLPGIGDYTAAAIAAIAFDKETVVVDGNIERVISRLYKIESKGNFLKKEVKQILLANIPNKQNSLFVQGLMDIGATICMPKIVNCKKCPLEKRCEVSFSNHAIDYPKKAVKKRKVIRFGDFYCLLNSKKEILFLKNEKNKLFNNMYILPSKGWQKKDDIIDFNLFYRKQKINCGIVKHSFSHFDLEANIIIYKFGNKNFELKSKQKFIKFNALNSSGIPTLYHKIISKILKYI